jgi:hypothetical protein
MRASSTRTGLLLACVMPLSAMAQFSFTNATNLKSSTTNSGGCMGVADMNGDGLDDLCILHNSRTFYVDYQNPDGTFSLVNYGQVSGSGQWGWALGDVDGNGHKDLVSGGNGDGVHYLRINSPGNATLLSLNNASGLFMQCNNIVDINMDGHNDFWACHDVGAPRQWLNDGNGNLSYANIIDYTSVPSSDMSGNYGSVWTDFDNDGDLDLYIAKCRQNVNNPDDPRRWNRLFVNDGNGNYSDLAASYGVQVRNQSWTADFADIDNDGDLDLVITNHNTTIQLFENDGTGHFTEITSGSGLTVTGFFLQSKFVDLDNDGYVDLITAGGSGAHYVFRNNGNKTFSQVSNVFPAPKAMHSFATGDLNNDGFVDVFANYGSSYIDVDNNNPDRLWLNDGNDNHWLVVRLQGTISNRDAIGARVTINGPWGTQIREVRAGESYGMVCTSAAMFGLGSATTVPEVVVTWPSGLVETFTDLEADNIITIVENTCISPSVQITTVGEPVLCAGGSLTLTANPGFEYVWSTGATSQSITVNEAGVYSVTISTGGACTGVGSISVNVIDETPSITVTGETEFCEGGQVVLTSSAAASYSWTGGATGQSITVTEAGSYAVTIQGECGSSTSAPVQVTVLQAPAAPQAENVPLPAPGVAQLTATGDNIQWYASATGGSPIGSGNTFDTPFLSQSTSFWCSATTVHGGEQAFGGKQDRSMANGVYHTNGTYYQLFTAYEPFILRSVKVYAETSGNRSIGIIDRSNGSTVVSGVFNIPAGESRVQLDFQVPAAGDYGLRIMQGNPQLWRDGLGSAPTYPYALGTVGAITSSSVEGANATAYYYFFYDWEVEAPGIACEGPRTEVQVLIGTVGVNDLTTDNGVRVWPNPANDLLTVGFSGLQGQVSVDLFDLTGRAVMTARTDAMAQQEGLVQLDVKGLAKGEYLVRVQHGNGNSVHRITVQ